MAGLLPISSSYEVNTMAKSKKSNSEKATKDKNLKSLKAEKPAKDKKTKKKEKSPDKKAGSKKTKVEASQPGKPAPKAPKPAKAGPPKAAVTFTTEELSLRAYFIAERRQAMGWPGDTTSDWVEAEKQLKAEALKKAKR